MSQHMTSIMTRTFVLIACLVFLSGCTLFDERIVVQTKNNYIPINCGYASQPAPIYPLPIRPHAIEDKDGLPWVGISPKDYRHLAYNTQESIRYIKDQKGVINFYQDCVTDFNSTLERLQNETDKKARDSSD